MTGAVALGVAAALLWPGLWRRPAWPFHLLRGESLLTDALLWGIGGAIALARVLGLLLVRDGVGLAVAAFALGATVALARRTLRSAAAPLLEDAVWLGGLALAGALGGAGLEVAAGGALAVLVGLGGLAALIVSWGSGHAFTVTARPDFQVFAPNPDNRYALGRIRVGKQRHVLAIVPDNGNRFTHVSVYDLRMRCVHLASWPEVRAAMAARGHLRVHLGPSTGDTGADLSFPVPPGRWFLTVRNYLPARPEDTALPRALAWDGTGAPPWSALEGDR